MQPGKILLTGADGFLGRYVSAALRGAGIAHVSSSKNDLDILNKKDVLSKTKGFNVVVHLAGNVRTPATDSAENHFKVNSIGTIHILEACRANKISRIILASSTEIYGNNLKSGRIKESDLVAPVDFYGQSKLLAEYFCRQYFAKFGINFTALRFTYLYGLGMYPSRAVAKIIDAAAGDKKLQLSVDPRAFMDILYVKDAARAVLLTLLSKRSLNKIINISSSRKTTILDLVKTAKHFYPNSNLSIFPKKEPQNYYIYDSHLAGTVLNFGPEYNLKAGVRDYIDCLENAKSQL